MSTPIWSPEAEQSVLGALMLENSALDRAMPLTDADFHHPSHAEIFKAIVSLHDRRQPVDMITVHESMGEMAGVVGGLKYLNDLCNCVPGAANIKRYAEIVRDRAARRELVRAAQEAAELAAGSDTLADVLNAFGQRMSALQLGQVRKAPRRIGEIALMRTQHYEDVQAGRIVPGWPTGLDWLDQHLNGGLRPGKLYFVAARPSVGKTSLSVQILIHLAVRGRPGLMLSQEMPAEEVADRVVSHMGRIDYGRLQRGEMDDSDWGRAADMLDDARELPVWIDDQGALTINDIRAKVRGTPGVQVLLLDYLQLCSKAGASGAANRNAEIEEISRGLKALAMELGLAVIVLSQLNREVEKRPGKRPQLSDLRDSGSIEQDADAVLMLWPLRDLYGGGRLVGAALEKNRQGQRGEVALDFRGAVQRWTVSTEPVRAEADEPAPQAKRRGFHD